MDITLVFKLYSSVTAMLGWLLISAIAIRGYLGITGRMDPIFSETPPWVLVVIAAGSFVTAFGPTIIRSLGRNLSPDSPLRHTD